MATKNDKMAALHEMVAQVLTELVTPKEVEAELDEDGEVLSPAQVRYPSPAELAVAVKFLKDNSIFSDPDQSDAMSDLKSKLAARKGARAPTKQDIADAMREIGAGLVQ